nr:hypothetical protein [Tanacetum cinerariifolium]
MFKVFTILKEDLVELVSGLANGFINISLSNSATSSLCSSSTFVELTGEFVALMFGEVLEDGASLSTEVVEEVKDALAVFGGGRVTAEMGVDITLRDLKITRLRYLSDLSCRLPSKILESFDKEDLEDLYKLVKAKFKSTRPVEDLDLLLWGDFKTIFEPHVEDIVWKLQQGYKVLNGKLYVYCVVHSLMIQSMQVYMLVEKIYPLTPPTLLMLEKKLQIDYQSKIAYQLLKLIKKQLKK